MNRKIIPYGRQTIERNDIREVVKILKSDFLTQGPQVESFEKAITHEVGSRYATAVNSATSALHIACKALDLKKGEAMWTSPITFVASANCGLYCDAKVNFVDVNPETGLMCTESLRKKLESAETKGELPKIVIPVHLCGTSCDMQEIKKLSERYKFSVIEDASHAIGGRYKDERVGSCKYSDITIFSFHPVKIITTAEGGVATTNNVMLEKSMKMLRSHGITKQRESYIDKNRNDWEYEQQILGYNYRMSDIQAALGKSQLKKLDKFIKKRKKIFQRYQVLTKSGVTILQPPEQSESAHHLCMIKTGEKQKEIYEYMRDNNIAVQVHYAPVHLQPFYMSKGFKVGDYPRAEWFARNYISIPIYPRLNQRMQNYVIRKIKEGMAL